MVRCNLIKLGVGWPKMWPERTDLRHKLVRELQRTTLLGQDLTMPIFSDNQACIALAKDPVAHSRTKHIDVHYHYIKELVTRGKATVDYCPIVDMIADILTKPLTLQGFQRCREKLITL
jgi:hypothetical protein